MSDLDRRIDDLNRRIDDLKGSIDKRFDDLKDYIRSERLESPLAANRADYPFALQW